MKKFLSKIFLFSISIFLVSLLLIVATEVKILADYLPSKIPLNRDNTTHQWTRLREADTTQHIQVLIVGSSLAQSIDVRNFQTYNLRAFNLSSGSQTPIQSSYLLNHYLDQFKPKLVIWDVNPYTFSNLGVESTIDFVSNSSDLRGIFSLLKHTNSQLAIASFFKRLLIKPFENENYQMPRVTEFNQYHYGGYMETFLEAPEKPMETDITYYQLLPQQKHIFESELQNLKTKSIPVILIYSPKSKSFIQNFQNQNQWFGYFNSLVDKGLAMRFINFNEAFVIDSVNRANFIDLGHLTRRGAKEYNQLLFDSISTCLTQIARSSF